MDHVSHIDLSVPGAAILTSEALEYVARHKAPWSAADIVLLREYYPFGGLAACRPHLPAKSETAIWQKARALGLRAPGYTRSNERWTTTTFIDNAIRRFYLEKPRRGGLERLARSLNRPARWVSHRARALGIVPPRFVEMPWSAEEVALLHKYASKAPITIARVLRQNGYRRTESSIQNKRRKLCCYREEDDTYSARALAELFGVTDRVVSGWISKGWLIARTRGTRREHDEFRIHIKAVRRFVIENAGAVDLRRVEKHWFIDMLAGGG